MNRKSIKTVLFVVSISLVGLFLYSVISSLIVNIEHLKVSGGAKLSNRVDRMDSTIFSDELLNAITIPFGSRSKIGRYNLYWLKGGSQLVVTSKGLPGHLNFLEDMKLISTSQLDSGEGHFTTGFLGGNFYLNPADVSERYRFCKYKAGNIVEEVSRSQDTLILRGNPGFLSLSINTKKGDKALGFVFSKSTSVEIAMFNSKEGVLIAMILSKSNSNTIQIDDLFRK